MSDEIGHGGKGRLAEEVGEESGGKGLDTFGVRADPAFPLGRVDVQRAGVHDFGA